jgi:phenylalanyl-tRNA synthetase beta chain
MGLAELDLAPLLKRVDAVAKVSAVPAFPMVKRDVAFVAGAGVTHEQVVACIRKAAPPELTDIRLFDIFSSKDIGKDRRSFAYSLAFRAADRTLTDDEVNRAFAKITDALPACWAFFPRSCATHSVSPRRWPSRNSTSRRS